MSLNSVTETGARPGSFPVADPQRVAELRNQTKEKRGCCYHHNVFTVTEIIT